MQWRSIFYLFPLADWRKGEPTECGDDMEAEAQIMADKLEADFDPGLLDELKAAGHEVEILPAYSSLMGHAGAIVRHPNGMIETANDPRSDGLAYAV